MKKLLIAAALAGAFVAAPSFAQSSGSIRVAPGHFCAINKCVRFSSDLQSVSVQARRPVSIANLGLGSNPVISTQTYREIFALALRQRGVNGNRG